MDMLRGSSIELLTSERSLNISTEDIGTGSWNRQKWSIVVGALSGTGSTVGTVLYCTVPYPSSELRWCAIVPVSVPVAPTRRIADHEAQHVPLTRTRYTDTVPVTPLI